MNILIFSLVLLLVSFGDFSSTKLSKANNAFGMNFFRKVLEESNSSENIIFSPFSIYSAVSMLVEGAKGKTKQELIDLLEIMGNENDLKQHISHFGETLENTENVQVSQGLFVGEGNKLVEEFVDVLDQYYSAKAQEVSFEEPGRTIINDFVKEKTKGMIKELLEKGVLSRKTVAVLINTLYFKNSWMYPFNEANTRPNQFAYINEQEDKGTGVVDMMHQTKSFFYGEHGKFKSLSLMFQNEKEQKERKVNFRMILVLPDSNEIEDYESVESFVFSHNDFVQYIKDNQKQHSVSLKLPKFEISWKKELNEVLQSLGMNEAFHGNADFRNMIESNAIVSKVIHQAKIIVDESGVEAAAATAICMEKSAFIGERKEFYCHKPFYYFLVEESTNTILFQGRVSHPTQSKETQSIEMIKDY